MSFNPWHQSVRAWELEQHGRRADAIARHERKQKVRALPFRLRSDALATFERDAKDMGFNQASRAFHAYVRDAVPAYQKRTRETSAALAAARIEGRDTLHEFSSDSSVRAWARKRADEAVVFISALPGIVDQYRACVAFCERWSIAPVECSECPSLDELRPAVARMTCPLWWRRRARRMLDRTIERDKINDGYVRRGKGCYVSDRNFQRGKEQAARNQQLLLEMVATNELGESFTLADLAEKSTANPHIRLSELMVRLKGCERLADQIGYEGLFVTWTLPSRFHYWGGDSKNEKWDNSTPRDGQLYLRQLWARARASLAKIGVRYFGIRVAEPHADATPHWHMLLFVDSAVSLSCVDLLRRYALSESPEESGAQQHRFKVERIEKSKGGATAYVAKYVSKMTTGAGLGETSERCPDGERRKVGKPNESALRARRWASVHGIRQFQFVGLPPVGIWRECRRLDETPKELGGKPLTARQQYVLEAARAAADQSDYAAHVRALGGAAIARETVRLCLSRVPSDEVNLYGEQKPPRVTGLAFPMLVKAGDIVVPLVSASALTRLHTWTISQRVPSSDQGAEGGFSAPWTRVNNCNQQGERIRPLVPTSKPFSFKFAAISAADQPPPSAAPPE